MFDVDAALKYLIDKEGSDLHLKVGAKPQIRRRGALEPIEGAAELSAEDTGNALKKICQNPALLADFDDAGEADFSYALPGLSRYRVNAFRQRGAISIVCRAIPFQVNTIDELGLPEVIRELADEPRGIVLLTGTTGSGKSTTLAAMIDHINSTKAHHVMTLEDPIEFLHSDKRSIINQREVGSDTESFARAMKRVLRQDPDVILIGEMRDEETVRTALSAAETGHLVLSTLHTLDATETINRIVDFFPPHHQQQARVMLAATLRGAVSQRLVQTADGKGRVAAAEILVVTGRVQDLILNPEETGKISEVIAEGEFYGMQTFDQSLMNHVLAGTITVETAMDMASNPHDFKLMLEAGEKSQGDYAQVFASSDAAKEQAAKPNGSAPKAPSAPAPAAPPAPEPVGAPAAPAASPAPAPVAPVAPVAPPDPVGAAPPQQNGSSAPPPGA